MYNKEIEIAKLNKDIKEIDDLFNKPIFDRNKAEEIIRKHNINDEAIGIFNSPINPNSRPFYMLPDESIKANLTVTRDYLIIKLANM